MKSLKDSGDLIDLIETFRREQVAGGPDRVRAANDVLSDIADRTVGRMRCLAQMIATQWNLPDEDADELLQQAWLDRIQQALSHGRPPIQSAEHFYRIVAKALRQTLADRWRSEGRLKRGGGRPAVRVGEDSDRSRSASPPNDARLDLLEAVRSLGVKDREAFRLRICEGVSREETAKRLQVTQAEVRKRLKSAKTQLAGSLADYA